MSDLEGLKASVCVPTHERAEAMRELVGSLRPPDGLAPSELCLADNSRTEVVEKIVSSAGHVPRVRYLPNSSRLGFAAIPVRFVQAVGSTLCGAGLCITAAGGMRLLGDRGFQRGS